MIRFRAMLSLLLLLTLLAFGTGAVPVHIGKSAAVLADEDNDESGNSDKQNKDEEKEKNKDRDEDEDEDKDEDAKDKDKNVKHKGQVIPAAPYRVEVGCTYNVAANETTCSFTGVAPEGAKDVGHVDLPASEVCAEVVGGEYEYVDPDPNTRVVGYKSRGSEGVFTLILVGDVTTSGIATYWFKTGDGAFPATGPGLICSAEAGQPTAESTSVAEGTAATATAAAEAADADTGVIMVELYACSEKPATAEFDWYGRCEPDVEGVALSLAIQEETGYSPASQGTTSIGGEFLFKNLAQGTYHLDAPETVWCHAESDHVDERGDIIVEAGAKATVWIFVCTDDAAT